MRRISNCELRIASRVLPALLALGCLAGCAGMPSFPDPEPGQGQIVVDLKGEPREGVGGPARETVIDGYSVGSQSVEQGKRFERVDYDAIEDVVVIVGAASGRRSTAPSAAAVEITGDGFSRSQLLLAGNSSLPNTLTVTNRRDDELTVFAFSDTDEYFEVTIKPGETGKVGRLAAGRYQMMSDEDEDLYCVLFVTEARLAWIGPSDDYPFFDGLAPGEYELRVYAPRLPEWSKLVNVTAGERTIVAARLTVNELPKVE